MTTRSRFSALSLRRINRRFNTRSRQLCRSLRAEPLEDRRLLNGSDILDFGDAWDQSGGDANGDPYPTLLEHEGARHVIVPGFFMGHRVDGEPDGQPTPDADGDDYTGLADDDGVTLHAPLVAGQTASFTVYVTDVNQLGGTLNAWIDIDGNGDWTSRADEHFVQDVAVTHGANRFDIPLPADATVGPTVVRFRLSTDVGLTPQFEAPDGEVEDYAVDILDAKWVQPPEAAAPDNVYLGWNEPSYFVEQLGNGIIAGDDWFCDTEDPVTEIVWWGSFMDWNDGAQLPQVQPSYFHFAIWTDVPVDHDPFSHPGTVLWEHDCLAWSMDWVGWDYDPRNDTYESCFRFSQEIPEEEWFYQEPGLDQIYWLTVSAVYDTDAGNHPFGMKTRPRDPESPAPDDAVRITEIDISETTDYIAGEPLEYPEGQSWDLAFELRTPDRYKQEQLPDPSLPGLHTHDEDGQPTPSLADNWICQGGDITDLHWWGNYENNYRGSGIQQFQLSIHTNAVGAPWDLPQDPGNYYIIPFPGPWITETDTGLVTADGSNIYKYEYVLDEPFVQEQGQKYWFDITAISNDDLDPPLWRWQEAQRGDPPIVDPAAEFVAGGWQSIQWTNPVPPPDYIYSDMAFAITSSNSGLTKAKWSQPPEPYVPQDAYYGWDEYSVYDGLRIAADDWLCVDDRPVTDIHWWGSFQGWSYPVLELPEVPSAFHIGIWTDVPANGQPYSHPGQLIWEHQAGSVDVEFAGWDFDPRDPNAPPEATFYFEQELDFDEWFWQEGEGNIYWLSIAAVYDESPETVQYPFGWKTRPRDVESPAPDDAVRISFPSNPDLASNDTYENGDPIFYPDPEDSWDMAFVLTTPPLDFGDADDSAVAPRYPTLLINDGARHVIVPDFHLGAVIDPEPGGQPTVDALGDDNDVVYPPANDDEDGVVVISPLAPGKVAQLDVTVTDPNNLGGVLNAWIDADGDGSFTTSPEEHFLVDVPVSDGTQTLHVPIPLYADPIQTTARFRLSTQTGLAPNGLAPDGEVEDYTVEILERQDIKWIQDPDLSPLGMDVRADEQAGLTLADDFECTSHGRLTDVHIWGSWLNDFNGGISNIRLSIHSDIPDPDGEGDLFSMPGELLWEQNFGPGAFQAVFEADVPNGEWWWDPTGGPPIFPGDDQVWRYDIRIDPDDAFFQEGEPNAPIIYWLGVRVDTLEGQFGWKTSTDHWNDDAVFSVGFDPNPVWNELRYPVEHPHEGESIDLAFALEFERPDLVGVHRRNKFFIDHNGNGKWDTVAGGDGIYKYGGVGDLPVVGDWNGDGFDEIGVYRPLNSKWYLDSNSNGKWDPGVDLVRQFGVAGVDVPVVGDWNGDGIDDVGVRRDNRFVIDANGNGVWDTPAGGDAILPFGGVGQLSAVGDWNADNHEDLGVYVATNGRFYIDSNGNRQWDGLGAGNDSLYEYARPNEIPVTGDWTGDGTDQVGTWIGGLFRLDLNGSGTWDKIAGGDIVYNFGVSTDTPVVGKWSPQQYTSTLLAAPGVAVGAARQVEPLTRDVLAPVVEQAVGMWSAAPLSLEQQTALGRLEFSIADLPGAALGQAFASTITIDVNAAGWGWFVEKYEGRSTNDETALTIPHSAFRIPHSFDLLTAVMHELGHVVGLPDDYTDPDSDDLMNGWLDAGESRTLTPGQHDQLFADADGPGLFE